MAGAPSGNVVIAVADYFTSLAEAKSFVSALKSERVKSNAHNAIDVAGDSLRQAVISYVEQLENAAQRKDVKAVFDAAHEIRGLAGMAGMEASGRIANGLCRYLDVLSQNARLADFSVIAVHLGAIARTAKVGEEAARYGEQVARDLAVLVEKRLAAINASETR